MLLAILAITFLIADAQAQSSPPRFEAYPVTETYTGKTAPLVLKAEARSYRTRLREAAQEKPNFAGRYILTSWGCGTGCLMGGIIDAKTGAVYMLPFSVCCWGVDVADSFNPIEFRLDSRLIVFSGARDEKEGDNGAHYYKFENGRLSLIRSILKSEAALSEGQQSESSAATREIKVYLVANDDDGKMGRKIGCGDSLVPVKRTIKATGSLLKAAIEELLAIPQEYTDEGKQLENYWRGTNLQVKSVKISAGVATVLITGELSVAGVCDEPRIESQIEETARQFPSVKKLRVFVNGRALKEAIR